MSIAWLDFDEARTGIATGMQDQVVRVWNLDMNHQLNSVLLPVTNTSAVAFSDSVSSDVYVLGMVGGSM